jgi:hypothetical protein
VPEHKPILPSGMFFRMTTTGDLAKLAHGVPFAIFADAVVPSVSSKALHLPVLSVSLSLPQDTRKAMQRMAKN